MCLIRDDEHDEHDEHAELVIEKDAECYHDQRLHIRGPMVNIEIGTYAWEKFALSGGVNLSFWLLLKFISICSMTPQRQQEHASRSLEFGFL